MKRTATTVSITLGGIACAAPTARYQLVDENNFTDVTFDAKIIKPGKEVKRYTGLEGITGKLQKSGSNAYLAKAFLRLKADNSDSIGEWNILITIHDNKRQSSISDSVKITLVR